MIIIINKTLIGSAPRMSIISKIGMMKKRWSVVTKSFIKSLSRRSNKRRKLQVLVKNLPAKPHEPEPFFGKGKDLEIVPKLSTPLPS
ncbi:hypothetical protein GBA52_007650 [Prunus armeniaca]|nr:hypothetical protein GBA52_007650 [Prunus armeniaca]